jgi:hypothetical protein
LLNGSWTTQAENPVYVLGDGTTFEGASNDNLTNTNIFSTTNWLSEKFKVTSTRTVDRFRVRVRKTGTPPAELRYRLYNADIPSQIDDGQVALAGAVQTTYNWTATVSLSSQVVFTPGVNYRLALYMVGGTSGNCYQAAVENVAVGGVYNNLTYDGTNSVAGTSANGGTSWSDANGNDIPFEFIEVPPTNTPTVTPTPTATATPTPTSCNLDVTGSTGLTSGSYSYCNVHVFSGGTLNINGAVTLTVSGDFIVDSGGNVNGIGTGFAAVEEVRRALRPKAAVAAVMALLEDRVATRAASEARFTTLPLPIPSSGVAGVAVDQRVSRAARAEAV